MNFLLTGFSNASLVIGHIFVLPAIFFGKRFDSLSSGHTISMSHPNEKTCSKSTLVGDLTEEQENPVPTTEASNGEVSMDPGAKAPAQDASEHLDVLDSNARRSTLSSWSDNKNEDAHGDHTDIDESEVGD